ncbi:MAG TPA: helix-turn-helix domain-containing protein [Steroidobacteraceae bacterium]|nr:helix-turn-helix domain-containing protein [Steroidobacteraceae bacterium]
MTMRLTRRKVPSFSLYGEQPTPTTPAETVHIEDIPSRSSKYLGQISSHRHLTLCQCIVVTAGPVTATLEDAQSTFDGPIAVVVPAGTIHGFRFRAETRGYVLTINLENLSSLVGPAHRAPIESLFATPRTIDLRLNAGLTARMTGLLDCLLRVYRQSDRLPDTVAGWLACSALWMAAEGAASSMATEMHSSADLDLLREFRSLVERHYIAHWPVERYARELATSETSLNRLCRRLTGSTGFDLVQQRMALEARRRLLNAGESVSMVANRLGFKDSAYFSRFFRRHSGVSPVEFRRRQVDVKVPTGTDFVQIG